MFLIYFLILLFSYFIKDNSEFFSFLFYFFIIIFLFFFVYYLYSLIVLALIGKKIRENFILKEEYINSNIYFKYNFEKFFLSKIKLVILTDKENIFIPYKNLEFKSGYVRFGLHNVKKFYIMISDILFLFIIKKNLKKTNFINYFLPEYNVIYNIPQVKDNDFYKNLKKDFSSDDLIRDYFFGDDPRKILWRSYFLTNELKYRDKWISETQKRICVIEIPYIDKVLNKEDYKILNYVYIKLFYFLYYLLKSDIMIKFNNNLFELKTFIYLQKEIFSINENVIKKNISNNGDIYFLFTPYFMKDYNESETYKKGFSVKIFLNTYDLFELYEKGEKKGLLERLLYKSSFLPLYFYYRKKGYKQIEKEYEKNFKIIF